MKKFSVDNTLPVLRIEYNIPEEVQVFGILARLSPEKRHADYIEAARLVHNQNPNTHFFIVGDGPTKTEMEHLAKDIDFITFTGMRRDIPNVLRSLNCFVLCSEVESLPLSIREAMSMRLPVVVTDVGGNREIVAEGVTGYLVPAKTPEKLAEAMLKIVKDKDKGEVMGKEAWAFCKDRFDAVDWALYTENKFQLVLDKK